MNRIKSVMSVFILLLLFTVTPAAAQEIGPPAYTTPSTDLASESLNAFEYSSSGVINKIKGLTEGYYQSTIREFNPVSGTINIAISPYVNEKSPDIAHGGDYYMVVYEEEYDDEDSITARIFSNEGDYVNTYTVQSCPKNYCEFPAVAYDAKSGYFLVTFGYMDSGSDWEVYAKAVSPTQGVLGDGFTMVTTSTSDEKYASLACNHDYGSCLVAYQTNHPLSSPIMGRFVQLDSEGIDSMSIPYDLTDATIALEPRLTWGRGTGTYMLTYRSKYLGQFTSNYTHVYDQPVNSGDQYLHGNAYVISPEFFSNDHNFSNNDVAFDPCTQHYVVTFGYDYYGNNSDYDIYAVAKDATDAVGWAPFPIVNDPDYTNHSRISFVTDDNLTPTCGSMDRLVFTYWNAELGIFAGELRGNNDTASPEYQQDSVFNHLLIHPHQMGQNKRVSSQEISSGSTLSEILIVYEYYDTNIPYEFNVKGQIISIMEKVFFR